MAVRGWCFSSSLLMSSTSMTSSAAAASCLTWRRFWALVALLLALTLASVLTCVAVVVLPLEDEAESSEALVVVCMSLCVVSLFSILSL